MPLPRSAAASERENASCACFDAAYGPGGREGGGAGDGDEVDDVRAALLRGGLQPGHQRARAPDAAEVVDLHHAPRRGRARP